ncbi:MAG: phage tail family protein [Oscillospiraceae bacterium]|nr:phage tail family protein [Oscillospiraceae bacterium]
MLNSRWVTHFKKGEDGRYFGKGIENVGFYTESTVNGESERVQAAVLYFPEGFDICLGDVVLPRRVQAGAPLELSELLRAYGDSLAVNYIKAYADSGLSLVYTKVKASGIRGSSGLEITASSGEEAICLGGLGGIPLKGAKGFADFAFEAGGLLQKPRELTLLLDAALINGELEAFFAPFRELTITVRRPESERLIKGFVKSLELSKGEAKLILSCPEPFFRDVQELKLQAARFVPQLAFPLVIGSLGVIAGYRSGESEAVLQNKGHSEAPLRAVITAAGGECSDIVLENLTTGKRLRLEGTLPAGSVLEISTGAGEKHLALNGINAVGRLDLSSEFFGLQRGYNLLSCRAASGNEGLSVSYSAPVLYVRA